MSHQSETGLPRERRPNRLRNNPSNVVGAVGNWGETGPLHRITKAKALRAGCNTPTCTKPTRTPSAGALKDKEGIEKRKYAPVAPEARASPACLGPLHAKLESLERAAGGRNTLEVSCVAQSKVAFDESAAFWTHQISDLEESAERACFNFYL